ncbi:ABC transporter ATP-binding protein [Streptomyces phaeolivaceus]|uniref:ABC transporter ATP-binding protein n=1 Tax=Streptomyces phaeolivaceus TaxID=2653200 RepID=A0A5P8JW34_9ACTN|nr:ABC transporter ATP-binding protein [Streptomyces phaeolivaceus]QFQ95071.1 ABC transporter ATP-binding protein [Streptomyces phaeolivaceus]
MSHVRIEGLTKRFAGKPPTVAVDDLSLEIEPGEFIVLLGPSGCGKTTTLRCLAGLETPDEGRISLGDQTVLDVRGKVNLPPNKRRIGMVFQSYALWPHMTVRRNIGYPLRTRRVAREQARERIEEAAGLVDCAALLDRYPAQLSGGQQQRVALARGLAARPDLVLFDEPLSNLDARLRDQVRAQLHELHARLGFTAVFVTHDQSEALALGDRLAIMRAGRIEQLDTPERVFEEPATEYVAGFIGMSNRLSLRRAGEGWTVVGEPGADGPAGVPGPAVAGELPVPRSHGEVSARLRPDDLLLCPVEEKPPGHGVGLAAEVVDAQFGGRHMDVVVTIAGGRLHARAPLTGTPWARGLSRGQRVTAWFPKDTAIYYDADGVRTAAHAPAAPVGA